MYSFNLLNVAEGRKGNKILKESLPRGSRATGHRAHIQELNLYLLVYAIMSPPSSLTRRSLLYNFAIRQDTIKKKKKLKH